MNMLLTYVEILLKKKKTRRIIIVVKRFKIISEGEKQMLVKYRRNYYIAPKKINAVSLNKILVF